jgi:2-phosphoglycerate kinase
MNIKLRRIKLWLYYSVELVLLEKHLCLKNYLKNIIIEGCYILPNFVKDFEREYLDQIVSVFIGFSTNYIKENFTSNIIKHRNAIENRLSKEDRPITQFINEHDELRKQCIEHGVEHLEINSDYEKEIQGVYDFIENSIDKMNRKNNHSFLV